jgi:hypothetical protein
VNNTLPVLRTLTIGKVEGSWMANRETPIIR